MSFKIIGEDIKLIKKWQEEYEKNIVRPNVNKDERICMNCKYWWESGMDGDILCGMCDKSNSFVFFNYDNEACELFDNKNAN